MANINNTSSYMDEDKKEIIKNSNYTYRDALEVGHILLKLVNLKESIKKCSFVKLLFNELN